MIARMACVAQAREFAISVKQTSHQGLLGAARLVWSWPKGPTAMGSRFPPENDQELTTTEDDAGSHQVERPCRRSGSKKRA